MRRTTDDLPRGDGPPDAGAGYGRLEAGIAVLTRKLLGLPDNHPSAVTDATQPDQSREHNPESEAIQPRPPLWDHVDRFRTLWSEHVRRWPDSCAAAAEDADQRRQLDPPGSWRGDGGQCLSPAENAEAEAAVESLQKLEPTVTELLRTIEQRSLHGGFLVGLDRCRKGADRLKEKMAEKLDLGLGVSPSEVAGEIHDAVRYTFCFDADHYVDGHDDVVAQLEASAFTQAYSRNHWLDGKQYKGINSQWRTSDGGWFELQFHTTESFYAKDMLTHPAYERLRSPRTDWAERLELESFQQLVCGAVSEPAGIERIKDQERRV